MKYIVCSIYNKDTKEYSAPLLYKTRKIAIADFSEKVEKMSKNKYFDSEDLYLFVVGSFDSDTGVLSDLHIIKIADGGNVGDDVDDDDDDDDEVK